MLSDLGATREEIASIHYIAPEAPPTSADLDDILDAGVSLVVLDSAIGGYALSDLDDWKRLDAEKFARAWLDPLSEANVTTLVIDHVVKNSDGRGKFAIGSERKLGQVDVHLGLHVVREFSRGGSGLVRIDTKKDRPGFLVRPAAAELELESDPETHAISWALRAASSGDEQASGWKPTVLMDRVLEHFARNPEPISRHALAQAIRGKRQFIWRAVEELLADGRLDQEGRKVFPVRGNVPGNSSTAEGNGTVPRSLALRGEQFSGTVFRGNDDIPF